MPWWDYINQFADWAGGIKDPRDWGRTSPSLPMTARYMPTAREGPTASWGMDTLTPWGPATWGEPTRSIPQDLSASPWYAAARGQEAPPWFDPRMRGAGYTAPITVGQEKPPWFDPRMRGAGFAQPEQAAAPTGIPSPPGEEAWWKAFMGEHEGVDPVTYYLGGRPPRDEAEAGQALGRALADRSWGEQFAAQYGRPPSGYDWEEHWYAQRGGRPGASGGRQPTAAEGDAWWGQQAFGTGQVQFPGMEQPANLASMRYYSEMPPQYRAWLAQVVKASQREWESPYQPPIGRALPVAAER